MMTIMRSGIERFAEGVLNEAAFPELRAGSLAWPSLTMFLIMGHR